jgi:hypothetical protein
MIMHTYTPLHCIKMNVFKIKIRYDNVKVSTISSSIRDIMEVKNAYVIVAFVYVKYMAEQ